MSANLPPIVKIAERLMLEVERAVRAFPRYHKYSLGQELRQQCRDVLRLCYRAWRARDQQHARAHRLQHAVARRFPWTSALDVRRRFRPAQLDHPISIRWRTA